ncbi:unnamed protein product [Fasciola hepatica]|uniref:Uncharacterized protein n=1 Tax=Fasciola hepatica TaxID=6192 RepID=A0ABC9HIG9_FASHE|nr:unnamed protein product [Fasciola hepatica]
MLQDPNGVIRIWGTGYYDKIQREGEFYVSAQRHMLKNKVRRQFEEFRAAIDLSLDERRKRLLVMLQTEDRKNHELSRLELEDERLLHHEETMKEATARREELENKECGLSDTRRHVLFAQSCVPYRQYVIEKHAREVAEDRKEITRYEEWDRLCQERDAEFAEKQKPHFEEQLEREDEGTRKLRQRTSDEIKSSYRDFIKRLQSKEDDKRFRYSEEQRRPRTILEVQGIEEESAEEKIKLKDELLKNVKQGVDALKKSRDEEKQKEKLVEAFCNKIMVTDCEHATVKKEALREEQLQFMRYQKRKSINEKSYNQCIDKLHRDVYTEKRLQEQRQRIKNKEKQTMFMKEVEDFRKAVSLRKKEEKAAEQELETEIPRIVGKTVKRENELLLEKEKERHRRSTQYALDLSGQQGYDFSVHNRLREIELEREKKAMTEAEVKYQELMKEVMLCTAPKRNNQPLH